MNEKFERLIERAGELLTRIEAVLPQPLSAPDWSVSTAWRYRKRASGHGTLEPVRHVAAIRLDDLKEIVGRGLGTPRSWRLDRRAWNWLVLIKPSVSLMMTYLSFLFVCAWVAAAIWQLAEWITC